VYGDLLIYNKKATKTSLAFRTNNTSKKENKFLLRLKKNLAFQKEKKVFLFYSQLRHQFLSFTLSNFGHRKNCFRKILTKLS